jgi:NAD(P)-dependent dehydrogenase (short-subunit alcohol dehydrogenase family)
MSLVKIPNRISMNFSRPLAGRRQNITGIAQDRTIVESLRKETSPPRDRPAQRDVRKMPTYFLTGANRGIGLELVRQLAVDGNNRIIAAVRSKENDYTELEALGSKGNVHIIECDVSSTDSISSLSFRVAEILSKTGDSLNYLFNVAGINATSSDTSLSIDPASLQRHMDINVLGPAKIVESLRQYLARGAVVMNLTSGLGSMTVATDVPKCCTYSISKAAQNMLSLHQARDLKRNHAIVICMDPGWVKTRMGGKGAMVEPEVSITGMLEVIRGLKKEDSGKFYRFDGSQCPW